MAFKFGTDASPDVVVLFAKFLVEPVVDDWVADVVEEYEIREFVADVDNERHGNTNDRNEEADGDSEGHLDHQNMLVWFSCTSRCCCSAFGWSTKRRWTIFTSSKYNSKPLSAVLRER